VIFWLAIALASVAGVALLLIPAWRARPVAGDSAGHDQLRRLTEFEADLAAGEIDPAEAPAVRADIERAVLAALPDPPATVARAGTPGSRLPLLAACLAVPLLAVLLYLALGSPRIATFLVANPELRLTEPRASLELLLGELRARVAQAPTDRRAWETLARAYLELRRYDQAVAAAERVQALAPDDPLALLLLIDALAMHGGGKLDGRPLALLDRLLSLAPDNVSGLVLHGIALEQAGDRGAAVAAWTRARDALPAEAPMRAELAALIADDSPIVAPVAITVEVALDTKLAAQANPGDDVFVLARAVDGPPMPLAVVRRTVAELPFTLTLDDSMAMVPGVTLGAFPHIEIVARVSRSGSAQAAAGDLEGRTAALDPRTRTQAAVLIDSVVGPVPSVPTP